MLISVETIGAVLSSVATIIACTWYLARSLGRVDRRLTVIEIRFGEHCRQADNARGRRNTGEFEALNDNTCDDT